MGQFYNNWSKETRAKYRKNKEKMTFTKNIKEISTDYIPKRIASLHITEHIKKNYKGFLLGTLTGIIITVPVCHTLHNETQNEQVTEVSIEENNNQERIPIKVYYQVQAGDTLSAIADKYEISINSIKENGKVIDKDKLLQVGTEIEFTYYITENQINCATEEIKTDHKFSDTMLAFIYHTDTETIRRLNEGNLMHDITLIPNFKGIEEIEEEMKSIYNYDTKTKTLK